MGYETIHATFGANGSSKLILFVKIRRISKRSSIVNNELKYVDVYVKKAIIITHIRIKGRIAIFFLEFCDILNLNYAPIKMNLYVTLLQ